MEDADVIREFILESAENLSRLDNEMLELERHPADPQLLASIFRTFHTIKGTCGFLGFSQLEALTHEAETLLSQMRDGRRMVTQELVSLILEVIDATRSILNVIESTGSEGVHPYEKLTDRLRLAAAAPLRPCHQDDDLAVQPESAPAQIESTAAQIANTPAQIDNPAAVLGDCDPHTDPPLAPLPKAHQPAAERLPAAESPARDKAAEEYPAELNGGVADSAIRVDVNLLDKLMNLVGELVLARNQILQFQADPDGTALKATSQRLNLITTELQEGVMKTRMQPIGVVWNKLPRVVRDLACSMGKQIRLEMHGASTELDKTIIEAIKDPLTHLVRNCCDHGVEPPEQRKQQGKPAEGRIALRAWHEGGQVLIEIADDGMGLNLDALKRKAVAAGHLRSEQAERMSDAEAAQLMFLPGLSTATTVSNVSGRGVGMDVVKCNVEKIGGSVDVTSRPGNGTVVRLKIPLTLAIIPGLVVSLDDQRSGPRRSPGRGMSFVIPQVNLVELVRLEGAQRGTQIQQLHNTAVYRLRGNLLPLVYLRETLRIPPLESDSGVVNIVVVQAEDRQFGLVVDAIRDTQEIVVKPLGQQLKGLNVYAGATIMGDGRVALILDVVGLGQRAGVLSAASRQTAIETAAGPAAQDRQRLLLFQAGAFPRVAVPLSMVARLEEFPRRSLEQASGHAVVQYRGGILPLIPLASILDSSAEDRSLERDPLQVIVFQNGGRNAGLVVDRILDIVEDNVTVRDASTRPGLLGSAIVASRVVDLLDLHYVLGQTLSAARSQPPSLRVLLAEPSAFSRGLLRSGIEMAGFDVLECATAQSAIEALERGKAGVVVTSLEPVLPGADTLIAAARTQSPVPLLVLAESAEQQQSWRPLRESQEDCQCKYDWKAMSASLARLATAVDTDQREAALAGSRS